MRADPATFVSNAVVDGHYVLRACIANFHTTQTDVEAVPDIMDAKLKRPVWTAAATKKIRDPHKGMKDMPKQVEDFVSKAFKKFPPKTN